MNKLMIGWSEVSITPDKPVELIGQFAERISQYVEKPITVTAMAVSDGNEQMILCSCDLEGVSYRLRDEARKKIAAMEKEIDPMKVVISAIHTHCGPGYTGHAYSTEKLTAGGTSMRRILETMLPTGKKYVESDNVSSNPDIMNEDDLLVFLSDRIAQAAVEAWINRKPGGFSNAFGRAPVGMCRRVCYSDGSAQMWGNAETSMFTELEGGNDSGIELMYCFDTDRNLTGIVANLACPAQCVQHRLFISPDFWGEARMLVRKHFGEHIFVLCQCSAAGDQCPVDLVRWVEPESDVNDPNLKRNNPSRRKADPSMFDLSGMKLAGRRVANEIVQVYEDGLDEPQWEPELVHKVDMMQLPLRRTTLNEVAEAKQKIREYLQSKPGDVDYNDVAAVQVYLGIIKRAELQEIINVFNTETHLIRFGSVAIATYPFELFLNYGNQIKARSHAEQTFIVQLANGLEGYLPTEKAERGGHYSGFIASGLVGHEGGDLLVRQTLEEINKMF